MQEKHVDNDARNGERPTAADAARRDALTDATTATILPFDAARRRKRQRTPAHPAPAHGLAVRLDEDVCYFPLLEALHAVGLTLKQDRDGLIITVIR